MYDSSDRLAHAGFCQPPALQMLKQPLHKAMPPGNITWLYHGGSGTAVPLQCLDVTGTAAILIQSSLFKTLQLGVCAALWLLLHAGRSCGLSTPQDQ